MLEINKYICFLGVLLFASPSWGTCSQSINVDSQKSVPATVAIFGGMNCADFENYRATLFVDREEDRYRVYEEWKVERDRLFDKVRTAKVDLENARASGSTETAKELAIIGAWRVLGDVVTVLGCSTTGPAAVACVAGFVINNVNTVYSLTTTNFNSNVERAKSVLEEAEENLENSERLGEAIMDEVRDKYLESSQHVCKLVKQHCL